MMTFAEIDATKDMWRLSHEIACEAMFSECSVPVFVDLSAARSHLRDRYMRNLRRMNCFVVRIEKQYFSIVKKVGLQYVEEPRTEYRYEILGKNGEYLNGGSLYANTISSAIREVAELEHLPLDASCFSDAGEGCVWMLEDMGGK